MVMKGSSKWHSQSHLAGRFRLPSVLWAMRSVAPTWPFACEVVRRRKEEALKLGLVGDNLVERLTLLSGILPPGIFECWFGIMLARTIMAATKLDVFENLAAGPLTADEVARRCG